MTRHISKVNIIEVQNIFLKPRVYTCYEIVPCNSNNDWLECLISKKGEYLLLDDEQRAGLATMKPIVSIQFHLIILCATSAWPNFYRTIKRHSHNLLSICINHRSIIDEKFINNMLSLCTNFSQKHQYITRQKRVTYMWMVSDISSSIQSNTVNFLKTESPAKGEKIISRAK